MAAIEPLKVMFELQELVGLTTHSKELAAAVFNFPDYI